MKREDYRRTFDEIPFSADFQERTMQLLRARESEKENRIMTLGKMKKMAVLAAAAVALLAVSVSAAVLWLTPAQVAETAGQPLLAEAFAGEDAIAINETQETGDFAVTLLGTVTGENLDVLNQDLDSAHTYAVLALRRLDGTPIEQETFDFINYPMTPLVAGYSPAAVNNWTLNAGSTGLALDGVYYYLLDTVSLEMFADHTVYMAFYEGGAPNNTIFTVNDDGSIAFADDFNGVHALFTLPLDPAKADPAAADAFAESTGLNHWTNDRTPMEDFDIQEQDTEDGTLVTIRPVTPENGVPYSAEEFERDLAARREGFQHMVDQGQMTQERYDEWNQQQEDLLAGLQNGTIRAERDSHGVYFEDIPAESGN